MVKAFVYIIGLLCICIACAQFPDNPDVQAADVQQWPNPGSTFLTEFGHLILDIDDAFSRQTAPKVSFEDSLKQQSYGRSRFRTNYFDQIRENYAELQRRLGSTFGIPDDLLAPSDAIGVNVQTEGEKSFVDVSLPLLPVKMSLSASNPLLKAPVNNEDSRQISTDESRTETNPVINDLPTFTGSIKVGNMDINLDSKPGRGILPDVNVGMGYREIQQRSKRRKLPTQDVSRDQNGGNVVNVKKIRQPDHLDSSSEEEFARRAGSEAPETGTATGPSGRILGDVLFSESTFDQLTRKAIKDHGKWALDSPLFPSSILNTINRVAGQKDEEQEVEESLPHKDLPTYPKRTIPNLYVSREPEIGRFTKRRQTFTQTYYDRNRDDMNPHFDTYSDPESDYDMIDRNSDRGTVVLAFTPDGVPLKLRVGSEIPNPLRFLHMALSRAGVSLNVPVESYDDMEPVGDDILLLGVGNGGMLTRALSMDLSAPFQMESLLRMLRKSRTS